VFDQLLLAGRIKREEAIRLLVSLINTNKFYQQNSEFAAEFQKRIADWKVVSVL
jgi:hypothetical protein